MILTCSWIGGVYLCILFSLLKIAHLTDALFEQSSNHSKKSVALFGQPPEYDMMGRPLKQGEEASRPSNDERGLHKSTKTKPTNPPSSFLL